MRLILLAALVSVAFAAQPATPKPLTAPSGPVGVTTRVFHPAARNWRRATVHALSATIWYPAVDTALETLQLVGPPETPLFEAGRAMPDAPIAPRLGQWPLLVLSHGSGGSALQMAWLGTQLARAGYVVVAVDHPGNTSNAALTPEGMALWWERATDLSNTIDAMLKDETLGRLLDPTRIGAAGYSLGGYTVLELAGARTDITTFFDECKKQPDAAVCHIPELRGMGTLEQVLAAVRKTSGESLARSGESYRDPRIKAVFAIAPALGFTQTPESLRAIKLPVELVAGAADETAPPRDNADYLRANIHGARENLLPGVTHYAFLDVCTAAGKQALERYCTDPAGMDRVAVHAQVVGEAIGFFNRALHVR